MAAVPEFREADMRYANHAGVLFLALIFSVGTAAAQEPAAKEDAEKRQGVTLTIYNGDTALVADRRKLRLEKGVNRIAIEGVSARLQPETAQIGRASCRERVCQYV